MAFDTDTLRAAHRLIEQFGAEALARAEERIAALSDLHDERSAATWRRIADAIRELRRDGN